MSKQTNEKVVKMPKTIDIYAENILKELKKQIKRFKQQLGGDQEDLKNLIIEKLQKQNLNEMR